MLTGVNEQTDKQLRSRHLQELIQRVQVGSDRQRAFAEFYDEVIDLVYSHALHVLKDAQAAEDVSQDALLTCWRSCSSYDPQRGSVLAWTMTIARSRTLDRLRTLARERKREEASLQQAQGDWEHGESADFDMEGSSMELSADIKAHLLKLPERERRILYMAYFAQLTHHEIAERMSLPEGTVKTVLYGALRKLRRDMGGETDEA